MIPTLNSKGNLPSGIHQATWEELCDRFGNTLHRRRLLNGLKKAVDALRFAGCRFVYIDGSFITSKEIPNDFDGCWNMEGVDPLLLDPVLSNFDSARSAQKAKYGGELFPAQFTENGSGKTFLEFFAIDKETGEPKGIIMINLQEV